MKATFLPFRHELIVDNFAGGGGASTGIEAALGRAVDIAINHDGEAIAMHAANHPGTRHLCGDVFDVDPLEVTKGQPVGLAWFSPDCKHFSKAKGGKPLNKKIRGLAWVVIRWAATVKPRVIALENVEEFQDWGPLLPNGKPDPLRAGMTFRRWKKQLENCGYVVESRELRACDYGAPTIRKRLFLIARCDGQPIVWPTPTHGPGREPYRTAAECIDWDIPCPSIFDRKRPLKPATLARIARGMRRFVLEAKRPFIVPVTHPRDSRVHDTDEPFRTVTGAQRGELAVVSPHITKFRKGSTGSASDAPLHTVTAGGDMKRHKMLVGAGLVNTRNGERPGQEPRVRDLLDPCPTVTAKGSQGGIATAYLEQANTGMTGHDARKPLSTIVGKGCTQRLVTAFLSKFYGTSTGSECDEPLHTVPAGGWKHALVQAFMEEHFGPGDWTTVEIDGVQYRIVDIGMRMLTPRELFRAQGFSDTYNIDPFYDYPVKRKRRNVMSINDAVARRRLSKTAQVRLVGNSVCPPVAEAIVRANFAHKQRYEAVTA